jgi:hypothetical protein
MESTAIITITTKINRAFHHLCWEYSMMMNLRKIESCGDLIMGLRYLPDHSSLYKNFSSQGLMLYFENSELGWMAIIGSLNYSEYDRFHILLSPLS